MWELHTNIWKAKIPYKIKIFLWLLENGATLTKENLIKRNWVGDPSCRFCDCVETTDHLFFQCPTTRVVWGIFALCIGTNTIPMNTEQYWKWSEYHLSNGKHVQGFGLAAICWAIWKAQNNACFERKLIKHSADIVCHACAFMNFWAGLYSAEIQAQVTEGVKTLLAAACRIIGSQQNTAPAPPRLTLVEETDASGDDED